MDSEVPQSPADPDRLNGWKEIASFLGKGVRTVQRWERELGLPVHRLGREGGEIVFAFKHEITDWSLAQDAARRGEVPEATAGTTATAAARLYKRAGLAAAALGLTAAVVAVFVMLYGGWPGPPPQPASWRVIGDELRVFGADGTLLWTRGFPGLSPVAYAAPADDATDPVFATIADLDGDGRREVLIGLVHDPQYFRGPDQGFVALNDDGSERFRFIPSPTVRFGTTEYRPPWLFYRMFLTHRPDGRLSLWAVFVHGMEFPTLLVELDAAGQVRSEYWSNGYVNALLEWTWRGNPSVFVGAANNETRGASLAVFDRNHVSGFAPATDPNYRCTDCPDDTGPAEFLVFPRRCVGRAQESNANINEIWSDAGDRVHVAVTEWSPGPRPIDANVYYWLGPDLTPERAEVSAQYRVVHQEMERAGSLDHPFGPADEAGLFPVRRWNGSTFVDLPTAPVTR